MLPVFITDKKGNVFLNELSRYVKGGIITPSSNQIPTTAAAQSGNNAGQSSPVVIEGPGDGYSEVYSLTYLPATTNDADVTNRMSVKINDLAWRRPLMNQDVLVDHVFGSRTEPYFLPESVFLEAQQTMTLQFYNNSTAGSASLKLAMEHRKFQASALGSQKISGYINKMRARKAQLYPFWFTTGLVTIPASGFLTTFLQIDRSQTFLAQYVMLRALSTGVAGNTQDKVSVKIYDGKTERPLSNFPIFGTCFGGTATFPYPLPVGWLLEPMSTIRIDIQNLVTDASTDVFVTLQGTSCFDGEIPITGVNPVASPSTAGHR